MKSRFDHNCLLQEGVEPQIWFFWEFATREIGSKSYGNSQNLSLRFDLSHWIEERSGLLIFQGDIGSSDIGRRKVSHPLTSRNAKSQYAKRRSRPLDCGDCGPLIKQEKLSSSGFRRTSKWIHEMKNHEALEMIVPRL
jgi:hypothetical protein